MADIRVLEDRVVNKIAAGEVVERPASIVKELIENSLDAGATRISVTAEAGGKKKIVVEDNGGGMLREDLPLSLLRHATSKISGEKDLDSIASLGFRGEALAAISSVGRTRIESRRKGFREGFAMICEGGKTGDVFPVGATEGTRITVGDLFFNTPAREKFLKSDATELTHIITLVESYSLARPEVAFSLRSSGAVIIDLAPASNAKERFFDLFPELDRNDFHDVNFSRDGLSVSGFIADPSKNLSTTRYIFTIVNGRLVRDKLIQGSIFRAYEETMPRGRFPLVFLDISINPSEIDVNVHPAKREIRFRRPGPVSDLITGELRKVLHPGERQAYRPTEIQPSQSGPAPSFIREPLPLIQGESPATDAPRFTPAPPSDFRVLAIWRKGFLLLDGPQGLSIVDQHTLHERIRFEQFRKFIDSKGPARQFLEPRGYAVPRALVPRISELAETLSSQGFEAEVMGESSIAVRSAPAFLEESEIDPLVEEFISEGREVLKTHKEILKSVLVMRSCRGSVMMGEPLSVEKAQYLIDLLVSMKAPLTCPHGRPIMFTLKSEEILARFGRR
ncbi:MAG TPA: DNA mismatch repair endonuclease MutL [Acidobacteriota bacterium]|nr:DNA mismatch repair endonuclease MutL [Acidobacteriota bacterium]HNT17160.1 DNA mismatch repair endonuclease MutL [Acidobacteriota bacterium]HPA27136.1 DNA mismatch repair endonuclease MutL [Acidobacteriota bacterium]HQQ47592.1 DNA mismatch repair endonuclease MutL [Acidobacteriota bacterium]